MSKKYFFPSKTVESRKDPFECASKKAEKEATWTAKEQNPFQGHYPAQYLRTLKSLNDDPHSIYYHKGHAVYRHYVEVFTKVLKREMEKYHPGLKFADRSTIPNW